MDDEAVEADAMLTAVGFRYSKDACCWLDRDEGRVISGETVAAHNTEWLARWITGK